MIVEKHPDDYNGLQFLTLIQYAKKPVLGIVDNLDSSTLRAYILDFCVPENVDEETILLVAHEWFETNQNNYPISIEFSRRGMTQMTEPFYKIFPINQVQRIIGPIFEFPMNNVIKTKKRRIVPVPKAALL